MAARWTKWTEDRFPLEELYVCPQCDAHMHVDSVGDTCPNCGAEYEPPAAIRNPEET